MKKLLSIAFMLCVTWATAQTNDFRKVNWGMSKTDIKQRESAKHLGDQDAIMIYQTDLAGFDMYVGYIFSGNQLVRGKYTQADKHTNKNDFIDDYKKLKSLLTKKYGSPIEVEIVWRNDLYKDHPEQYGMAVSSGHLLYYCTWKTNTTSIMLALTGENFSLKNTVEYEGLAYKGMETADRESKALKELKKDGFRDFRWGDAKSKVKREERLKLLEENREVCIYESKWYDLDMYVGYLFTNDILTRGRYILNEKHTNKNDFINDFEKIEALLEKKYGEPISQEVKWKNSLYKNKKDQWGMAVSAGHLEYTTVWKTADTFITVILNGENFKVSLMVDFTSVAYQQKINQSQEKKALDQF